MKKNPLQDSLDQVRMIFDNGWNLSYLNRGKTDCTQVLVQIPASEIIEMAVMTAFTTFQAVIDNYDKITSCQLLNRTDAAIYLGCSRQTLINYENNGIIIPIRMNGQPYYRQIDLDNVCNNCSASFKKERDTSVAKPKVNRKARKVSKSLNTK